MLIIEAVRTLRGHVAGVLPMHHVVPHRLRENNRESFKTMYMITNIIEPRLYKFNISVTYGINSTKLYSISTCTTEPGFGCTHLVYAVAETIYIREKPVILLSFFCQLLWGDVPQAYTGQQVVGHRYSFARVEVDPVNDGVKDVFFVSDLESTVI